MHYENLSHTFIAITSTFSYKITKSKQDFLLQTNWCFVSAQTSTGDE